MAMTGAGAFQFYKAALAGQGITFNDAASEAIMTALFQAMIDEIKANMTAQKITPFPHTHRGINGEIN